MDVFWSSGELSLVDMFQLGERTSGGDPWRFFLVLSGWREPLAGKSFGGGYGFGL